MNTLPPAESLPVAVRAFASPLTTNSKKGRKAGIHGPPSIGFSDWTLIFDTETTTDASQQLRFGVYQVRKWGRLRKAGFFYDPPLADRVGTGNAAKLRRRLRPRGANGPRVRGEGFLPLRLRSRGPE
jgi:hypothetical protein